jgi:hypothetical protein
VGVGQAWRVRSVDPPHSLVLEQCPPQNPRPGTWSLVPEATSDGRTRLISRHCALPASGYLSQAAAWFWSLTSVMERRMLLGIKERPEKPRLP